MSKTQIKLVAAVETTLSALVEAGVMSAAVDVGSFRAVFGLTSMGKKSIARAIDDMLTTNGIVDQFGPWVMAEIEHPMYQLSMLTPNRVVLVHKEGAPYPEGTVEAGFGIKDVGDDEDDLAHEDAEAAREKAESGDKTRESEEEEDDAADAKAMDNRKGMVVTAKPGEDLRSLSPEQLVARAKPAKGKKSKPAPKAKKAPVKQPKPAPKAKKARK